MTTSTDRTAFRALVAEVAERAKAILPASVNGRIEKAIALVLAGDVEPQADGTVLVFSATDATRRYVLQGPTCTCQDFERGQVPEGWCAHRISAGIHKRVTALLPPAPEPAPPGDPLPEAPCSITLKASLHGYETLVTLRGTDFASVQAQVEQAAAWLKAQAPAPAGSSTPQCPTHGAMKPSTKGQGWYCPHKTAAGQWCPSKSK